MLWQQDLALTRHNAYQMMKLFLDGPQIVKNIGMIEFKIIQNQRTWAVMDEFRALVEKRAVVFISLNDKEWAFS